MTRICRTLVGGTLALGFGLPATAEVLPGRAAAAKTAAAAVFAAAGRAQPAGESTASAASILAVEGKVRYRLAPDQAWQQAKAGVALGEGAEIETAIRSAVQIKVGSAQVLTIDRASRVAIKEAINRAGTDKTTVDLPYGRVKFEVNSATVANEVKIQAPDATLAVKGTIGYMEVTPGQPTLAYGGQNNTGTFNVTYAGSGTTHPVTEQQQTNATAPDPASNSLEQTHVDVGAPAARSGDETQQVTNSPGGGESLTLITGGGNQQINTPPRAAVGPTDIAFINFDGSAAVLKRRGALGGDATDVLDGAAFTGSFNPASANAGLALAPDASGAGRDLLRLESDSGGWTLLGLGLQGGTAFDVRSMSSGQSSEFLFGLGSIGNRLFTGGRPSISAPDELSGIYEIMQGSSSVQRRMSLPMALGGDLAGSAERGTVWVYGQPGARDSFFASGTFFEVDPRSNAVLRVTAPLIAGPTTVYGDGVSPGMLISGPVRGLAFSADRIIAQVGGLFVVIDPTAQGTATSPTIVAVSLSAATLPGLASESLNRPPAPFNLAPSTGLIDPALQPLFAQMGYTAVAASSPFFRQMVAGEVIRTASDPQGCQGTISLAGLGSALAGHAGQAAGVGQGVNDYRMGLTIGHACLLPGQVPTLPVLLGVAAGGDLLGFDLNGVETPQLTGINPPLFGMGAALRFDPGTGGRELLIMSGAASVSFLSSVNLANPGAGLMQRSVYAGNELEGLATIGPSIFSGGPGPSSGGAYSIYELTLDSSTLSVRAELPFFDRPLDLAGSNERGSLFVIGQVDSTGNTPSDSAIFEVDPRNFMVKRVTAIEIGPTTAAGPGVDLTALRQHNITLTGSAYVGNRLVVTITDTVTGLNYFVIINPGAAGTPADPSVIRVTQTARDIYGLASESTAPPPPPMALGPTQGAVDTSIGFFAAASFSAQAASAPAFRTLVQNAIIATSVNPQGCASSLALNNIGSFLGAHVGQINGVGRAVADFRTSLGGAHPCLVPGAGGGAGQVFYLQPDSSLRVLTFNGANLASDSPLGFSGLQSGAGAIGNSLAMFTTPSGTNLYQLLTSTSGTLASFNLNRASFPIAGGGSATIATNSGSNVPILFGLGVLGDTTGNPLFYSAGFDISTPDFGVYNLLPSTSSAIRVMSLPGYTFDTSLTGVNARGTVLVVGARESLGASPVLTDRVLLEVDPRSNSLVSVTPFTTGSASNIPAGFDLSTARVVGIAPANNVLVMSVLTSSGQFAFLTFNPLATGSPSDPSILSITLSTNIPVSLASGGAGAAGPEFLLQSPTTEIDHRTGGVFPSMGYSSTVFTLAEASYMVRTHLLDTASDATSCAASSEINQIAMFALQHANQVGGIGQTLGDIRFGLPFNHPCQLPEGMLGAYFVGESASPSLNFAGIDNSTPQSNSLPSNAIQPINPNSTVGPSSGGLALAAAPNGPRDLFRVESVAPAVNGQPFTNTFLRLDLRGGAAASFSPAGQIAGGRVTGLAAIGQQLFAAGAFGPNGEVRIQGVNLQASQFTPGVDAPFLGQGGYAALGGSNERGSVFINALAPTSSLVNLNPALAFAILEFDPRNNLFMDAILSSEFSGGVLDPNASGTSNSAGMSSLSQITRVDSIAYNQGLITVTGEANLGAGPVQVSVQANTFGNNSPGNPVVRDVRTISAPRFGTAGNIAINPPGPLNLSNPGGTIDMRGLSAQFADLAYTQRAVNSGIVQRMAERVIIDSATAPSACQASMELANTLAPQIQSRVNQRMGMGRAINDFRNSLPVNHPCRPL